MPRVGHVLLTVLWLFAAGCDQGPGPVDDDADAADAAPAHEDTGDDDVADDDDTGDDDDDDTTGPTVPARVITAEVTWELGFDAEAEAAGYTDCSYSRTFTGVQYLDQPYLCPDCTHQFQGTAEMVDGFADCAEPIFGGSETRTEYWGLGWSEAAGTEATFFRGSRENQGTGELTSIAAVTLDELFELGWNSEYSLADMGLPDDGQMTLVATGTATVTIDDSTQLPDLYQPRTEPYECGWPTNNPGNLETDWLLQEDTTFPTAWLEDECGELVNLWDFHGSYLVLDSTQPDCYYCILMAEAAPDFLAEMDDAGIPTVFISLLGEGLSNIVGEPTQGDFEDYIASYGSGEPILKDRGFGYAIFEPYWGDDLGYPSWTVVRPDMTGLAVGKGFSSFEEIRDLILADAN